MNITADSSVDFTVQNAGVDQDINLKVTAVALDGTVLSLQRYQFNAGGHAWQAHLPPANTTGNASNILVSVDANGNGVFDAT